MLSLINRLAKQILFVKRVVKPRELAKKVSSEICFNFQYPYSFALCGVKTNVTRQSATNNIITHRRSTHDDIGMYGVALNVVVCECNITSCSFVIVFPFFRYRRRIYPCFKTTGFRVVNRRKEIDRDRVTVWSGREKLVVCDCNSIIPRRRGRRGRLLPDLNTRTIIIIIFIIVRIK